jgi:hypothetical protein
MGERKPSQPRNGDWMQMNSGLRYWPLDPRTGDFDINDIAHGLAYTCRWGGQSDKFYSVAEHSVLVSRYVDAQHRFPALMHDAAEAYIGDIPRPLKRILGGLYGHIEARTEEVIANTFGVPVQMHPQIKAIDNRITVDERVSLFENLYEGDDWMFRADEGLGIKILNPLPPAHAKQLFLEEFYKLEEQYREGAWT